MFEGITYEDLKDMSEVLKRIRDKGYRATINKRGTNYDGNMSMEYTASERIRLLYTDHRDPVAQAYDPDTRDILEGLPKLSILWEVNDSSCVEGMYFFTADVPDNFFEMEEGVEDDLPWT